MSVEPVGKDGESLWTDCRKPAAAAVERSRYQLRITGSAMPLPAVDRRWIFQRSNAGPKRRDRALWRARSRNAPEIGDYFSELLMVLKFVDSWLPTPFTAVMIAIAIPAAIRPYSMAVAPDSSLQNDLIIDFMAGSDLGCMFVEPRLPLQFLSGNIRR